MKKITAAILTSVMLVVSTACGPQPPAQTPVSVSEPEEESAEEEGWCTRNFDACAATISIVSGVLLGGLTAGITYWLIEEMP